MKNESVQNWLLPATWLRFLIIVLLLIGIFFRLFNLDRKVYWHDETLTSLTNSGYTWAEVSQQGLDGHVLGIQDLQKYQRTSPEKDVAATISSLSTSFPEHSPLYYLLSRFWVQWFGNSVAVTRSLSALISLLAFPCMYWLCLELFKSSLAAWIAIALLAVSPFHLMYAQEAREYSLWTVTILLSGAALLRAMRLTTDRATNRISAWGVYAATVALGLYSYMFSVLILIGHGIYVIAIEKFRLSKTLIAYLLASFAGFLAFMPWLLTILPYFHRAQKTMTWVNSSFSLPSLVAEWTYNLSYVFVDFWYIFTYFPNSPWNLQYGKYLIPLILVLVGYALYFLYRKSPLRVWFFILTLISITALSLALPDLVKGGYRSTQSRYLTPCYIGIQLAVAYLIARQINPISITKIWQQKLWQSLFIALISAGVLSGIISSQAETWWSKRTTSYDDLQTSRIINQTPSPLLITEGGNSIGHALTLTYLLEPKVRLQLFTEPDTVKVPRFSYVFAYEPPQQLLSRLKQQNYEAKLVYKGRKKSLWRLEEIKRGSS